MADLIQDYSTANVPTNNIGDVLDQLMGVARDSRRGFEKRWYDNNFFDDGFHFRYFSRQQNRIIDMGDRSTVWEPMRSIPKSSRQLRGVANLLLSQEYTPIIYPEKVLKASFPDPNEFANALKMSKDIAKKVGHWTSKEFKKQEIIEKIALMLILTGKHGVSYLQIWPDAVEEAIRTQVFDAFDIYLIGSLTEIKDSPFVVKTTPQLISQIKANENFDAAQLLKISPDNRLASSEIKEAYMRARYGKESSADQVATLMLKEAFIKEYVGRGNMDRIRSQRDGGIILKNKKEGDPVIRQVFSAGNVWLKDKYINLPDYPIVDLRFEPGPIYQVPLIERFIPANKSLDMAVSRLERFFHTMNVGVWLKRQGEQFNITNQSGGQVVEYESTPPTQGSVASPSAMSFPFVEFLTSLIEEQGVSTSALAKLPPGVKANAAIETLKESENANLALPRTMLKNTVKRIAEKMLDIADNYFVTPQTVFYLDRGEPQYFDVIGNAAIEKMGELKMQVDPETVPLKKDYQVEIEVQAGMAYTKEGQREAAKELGDYLIQLSQIGLVSPEVVKIFTQQLLETYQFGATQEIVQAIDDFGAEGMMTEEQTSKVKIALAEVMADLQKGGVLPTSEQRVSENKLGLAQAISDIQKGTGENASA